MAGHMVLARLGWELIPAGTQVSLLWLPAGWAGAAFWRCGRRAWLPLLVGGVLDSLVSGTSPWVAGGLAAGNAVAAWVFAWTLRFRIFDATFSARRDVQNFVLAALASSLVAALCGVGTLGALGRIRADVEVWELAGAWVLSDLLGLVLFAPWLMDMSVERFRRLAGCWRDLLLIGVMMALVGRLAFDGDPFWAPFRQPALVASTLVVLFAALRLQKEGALLVVMGFCIMAAVSSDQSGIRGLWDPAVAQGGRLLLLWSYAGTLALTALLVTALQAERATAVENQRLKDGHISTALSAIGDAVLTTGADDCVTWINDLAVKQLGFTAAAEVVGRPLGELLKLRREKDGAVLAAVEIVALADIDETRRDTPGWLGEEPRLPVEFRVSAFARRSFETGGVVLTWRDITPELRRAREAQETNERLSLALAASGACTWELDVINRRIRLDERWAGLLKAEVIAPTDTDWQNIVARSHPEEREEIKRIHRRMIFGGQDDYLVEQRVKTERGEWIWIESRGRVVEREPSGRAKRVIGTNIDISARKAVEFRLQAQNAFLESLQLLTFELVEARAMEPLFNQALQSALGILRGDFGILMLREGADLEVKAVAGNVAVKVGDRLSSAEQGISWAALSTGHPVVVDDYRRDPRANARMDHASLGAVMSLPVMAQGQGLGVLSVGRRKGDAGFSLEDIERGRMFSQLTALVFRNADSHESALRMADHRAVALAETELRFQTVFDHSPVGQLLTRQPEGVIMEVNAGALRLFGLERDDVIGRTVPDLNVLHDPEDRARFFARLRANGVVDGYEFEARRRNGERISVSCYAQEVKVDGQRCLLTTIVDITARRRAEQRFQTLFEYAPDAMFLGTWDGRIVEANLAARTSLGSNRDELMFRHCLELVAAEDAERMKRMLELYAKRDTFRRRGLAGTVFKARGVDGREFPAHLRMLELPSSDHNVVVATLTDLTAQRAEESRREALEIQLRRAQKMDALGTLAGGVAHDFNNLLTAIIGYAELVMMSVAEPHPARPMMDRILEAANRSRDLVAQILTFSRREESRLESMALQPAVRDAVKLLRSTIPAMVRIEAEIRDDCPSVRANGTQIYQIVMNLGTNAWHAIGRDGGVIRIVLEPITLGDGDASKAPALPAGRYVRLSVLDNGPGVPAEIMDRIFDPFFTTKKLGEGTGLGLAVVHGIVTSHGGAIVVENGPAGGAGFYAYFPVAPAKPESPVETADAIVRGKGQTVLLLDDDELTGDTLATILRALNYRVVWNREPQEALRSVLDGGQTFELIVTDLALPNMSGLEFAEKVRAVLPEQRMVLLSGNVTGEDEARAMRLGMRAVLRKPVELPALAGAVHRALS